MIIGNSGFWNNVKDHRAGGIDGCEAETAIVAGSGASPCSSKPLARQFSVPQYSICFTVEGGAEIDSAWKVERCTSDWSNCNNQIARYGRNLLLIEQSSIMVNLLLTTAKPKASLDCT
jgi:hypothetical protein